MIGLKKAPKGHPEVGEMVAFMGKGTEFKGILKFEGTIRVDGRLDGEVHTQDTLIVGESAELTGELNVGTLITSGSITGNIVATKTVHFVAPGSFTGEIATPAIQIDEGFSFNGRCFMGRDEKAAAQPRAEVQALSA